MSTGSGEGDREGAAGGREVGADGRAPEGAADGREVGAGERGAEGAAGGPEGGAGEHGAEDAATAWGESTGGGHGSRATAGWGEDDVRGCGVSGVPSGDGLGGDRLGGGAGVEVRTRAQRRVDVLTEIIQRASGLPGMPQINGAKPVVTIRATLDDVVAGRGVGWIDGIDEPVPASVVEQLVCHGDIITTLFGQHGQILQHGKTRRLFTPAQNRALAARDGGCVWKGCDRAPAFCESHHAEPWKSDTYAPGRTDVGNAALLCAFHHRHLHTSDWKLVMVNGVPHLIPPRWVDPDQRPQRCRQQSDRLIRRVPTVFDPGRRATRARPRFTDVD